VYIPVTSRPYLFIPIEGPQDAGVMATWATEIALIADDGTEPADGDWHTAAWIGGEPALLIGDGTTFTYPAGYYFAFARLTAGEERLVLPSGRVRIGEPPGG
jgi:hypothetical protein